MNEPAKLLDCVHLQHVVCASVRRLDKRTDLLKNKSLEDLNPELICVLESRHLVVIQDSVHGLNPQRVDRAIEDQPLVV
eukprot:4227108-Amphidinium_carterae.1